MKLMSGHEQLSTRLRRTNYVNDQISWKRAPHEEVAVISLKWTIYKTLQLREFEEADVEHSSKI